MYAGSMCACAKKPGAAVRESIPGHQDRPAVSRAGSRRLRSTVLFAHAVVTEAKNSTSTTHTSHSYSHHGTQSAHHVQGRNGRDRPCAQAAARLCRCRNCVVAGSHQQTQHTMHTRDCMLVATACGCAIMHGVRFHERPQSQAYATGAQPVKADA